MIKYDFKSMLWDNRNSTIFARINALNFNYEETYAEAGFYDLFATDGGRRAIHCWYYIRIDQDGVSLHISRIIPKKRCVEICERIIPDAAAKMAELWAELKKYQFEPIGYEIRGGEQYWLKGMEDAKTDTVVMENRDVEVETLKKHLSGQEESKTRNIVKMDMKQ